MFVVIVAVAFCFLVLLGLDCQVWLKSRFMTRSCLMPWSVGVSIYVSSGSMFI